MSVTTMNSGSGFAGLEPRTNGTATQGFFSRMAEKFVESRMRQAEYRVKRHLQTLDRASLRALKLSDTEIARLQAGNF